MPANERNDISEIVNILNLYAVAVDTLQWDIFDQVFTPDVHLEYPRSEWNDLETFKKDFHAAHLPYDTTQHMVMNHMVKVNGDKANAMSYVNARIIRAVPNVGGGNFWEIGAWYDDELVRTPKGWRIKRRACRSNWTDGDVQVTETTGAPRRHQMDILRKEAVAGKISFINAVLG
jgi:hypothetical protein